MKHFFLLLLLVLPSLVFSQDEYVDLVWSDEFDVDGAPNPVNWGYDLGAGGWGNNEVQNYTNSTSNARIENGRLLIEARKNGDSWTSARLKSQGKKNFSYGKIVFRAKLPPGQGTWPALWMLGEGVSSAGWPACGEIDIMEHVGKRPGVIQSSLHTTSSSGNTVNTNVTTINDFDTNFHTYEALWTPDKIQFAVDGVPFYTYNPTNKNAANWPFNAPFFIIMNIAMGGNFGGPAIDPSLTLVRMEVDYVRVYQNFKELSLQGPGIVQKNQNNIFYKTNQLQNATYEWTLPQGAQIVSGSGTSSIVVNWGEAEGDVKVKVSFNNQTVEKAIPVLLVSKPQGSTFSLFPPGSGVEWTITDPDNTYKIATEKNALRVDYTIKKIPSVPALTGRLIHPLDLTDYPILHVRARSANKSKTLLMRMDWVDENGLSTNKSPVFNFTPLIDDGEYYDYWFNFATSNNWQSTTNPVNPSRITKLNFFIDFGVFGSQGSDSLWVENIWTEQPASQPLAPNRPSHLKGELKNGSLALSWNDNATNETGFEIFTADSKEGAFTLLTSAQANATAINVAHTPGAYYTIRSYNTAGPSMFSNKFTFTNVIASIEEEGKEGEMIVHPNPAHTEFCVTHSFSLPVTLRIVDSVGRETYQLKSTEKRIVLALPFLISGFYYVQLSSAHETKTQKLIIQ